MQKIHSHKHERGICSLPKPIPRKNQFKPAEKILLGCARSPNFLKTTVNPVAERYYQRCCCNDTKINRAHSLPPRPPTRRSLSDSPFPQQCINRANSSGPSTRAASRLSRQQKLSKPAPEVKGKAVKSPTRIRQALKSEENINKHTTGSTTKKRKPRINKKSSNKNVTDNDYLQFSLRITEDIIKNELYSNSEMHKVFNSHIEANRGRLDLERMQQQIADLCKELRVPLSKEDESTSTKCLNNESSSCAVASIKVANRGITCTTLQNKLIKIGNDENYLGKQTNGKLNSEFPVNYKCIEIKYPSLSSVTDKTVITSTCENDIKTIFRKRFDENKADTSSSTLNDGPLDLDESTNFVNSRNTTESSKEINFQTKSLHLMPEKTYFKKNKPSLSVGCINQYEQKQSMSRVSIRNKTTNQLIKYNQMVSEEDSSLESLDVVEATTIYILGPNNTEIEYVLQPGTIYIPKLNTDNTYTPQDSMLVAIHKLPTNFSSNNVHSYPTLVDKTHYKHISMQLLLEPDILFAKNNKMPKCFYNLPKIILSLKNFNPGIIKSTIMQINNINTILPSKSQRAIEDKESTISKCIKSTDYSSKRNMKCNPYVLKDKKHEKHMKCTPKAYKSCSAVPQFNPSTSTQTATSNKSTKCKEAILKSTEYSVNKCQGLSNSTFMSQAPNRIQDMNAVSNEYIIITKISNEEIKHLSNEKIRKAEMPKISNKLKTSKQSSERDDQIEVQIIPENSETILVKKNSENTINSSESSTEVITRNRSQTDQESIAPLEEDSDSSSDTQESWQLQVRPPSTSEPFNQTINAIPETLIKRELIEMISEENDNSLEPSTSKTELDNKELSKKAASLPIKLSDASLQLLRTLDKMPDIVTQPSIIENIENVKKNLDTIRHTEIPVSEYIRSKYNFSVHDVKPVDQKIFITADSDSDESVDADQLPLIQAKDSEESLKESEDSAEIDYFCCGLRRMKKKKRRDDIEIIMDYQNASTNYNISSIPDNQLEKEEKRQKKLDSEEVSHLSTTSDTTKSDTNEPYVPRQAHFNSG